MTPGAHAPIDGPPIGMELAAAAKVVSRAFDDALRAAGGSRPTWLVLVTLKRSPGSSQRDIAEEIGIRGPTLTHHLDALERDGLIARRRDPRNRRTSIVELTEAGETSFESLRAAAVSFDERLRAGTTPGEIEQLRMILQRMETAAVGR